MSNDNHAVQTSFDAETGVATLTLAMAGRANKINADFGEQWDMTQWYQVFNLELELDIAPDGFGPFDLLQAYVRAEVRFDCIYTHGCGMFQSVNAFGDKAKSLPRRLSNAEAQMAAGQFKRDATYTSNNGYFRPQFKTGLRLSGGDFTRSWSLAMQPPLYSEA